MKAEFGPGRYFLGDICYVLDVNIYVQVWGIDNEYKEGVFPVWKDTPGSESFAVADTAYGNGEYTDNQGHTYPVDAGVIGIVPESMWKVNEDCIKKNALGAVLDIKENLIFEAEGGIFKTTADGEEIVIDITGAQSELDDWWDDWDDFDIDLWHFVDGGFVEGDGEQ